MPVCEKCKKEAECKMYTVDGAFGPVDVQTCEPCLEIERKSVQEESRRVGFRLKCPKPWAKLDTHGVFGQVR